MVMSNAILNHSLSSGSGYLPAENRSGSGADPDSVDEERRLAALLRGDDDDVS